MFSGWPTDEEMISSNAADHFQWLSKDQLCILVYLVTVMHSMQVNIQLRMETVQRNCEECSSVFIVNYG